MKALTSLFTMLFALQTFALSAQSNYELPRVVSPASKYNEPPSDAIVLFDGKNFNEWQSVGGGNVKWKIENGAMTVTKGGGSIETRRSFEDIQFHIEWRIPANVEGEGQNRGNSGIHFQRLYEVQILDSYNNENPTYVDGTAGSIYTQSAPLVNACRKAGEWQSYDVVYKAPRFKACGALETPAAITVFQNGVLIQNHFILEGTTYDHSGYKPHGKLPIQLQDHGTPISFRNIWVRELSLETAKAVAPYAEKHGLYLIFHNHCQSGDPNFSYDPILAVSKNIMLNFDVGHYYGVTGKNPCDLIRKYHSRIASLHLKDKTGPTAQDDCGVNQPWGQGTTPIKEILQLLKTEKYPIEADIELEYGIPQGSDAVKALLT